MYYVEEEFSLDGAHIVLGSIDGTIGVQAVKTGVHVGFLVGT
jgi:hypothetical protein